ncbi:MAG: hypothetical protein J6Q39_07170 [Bacteroidales bacterium]|nr:hypothetical protein [Bacteroidales bacterium]
MFQYKNLPDSIDCDILERYLQLNGICCVTKYKDKLYAFNGSLGGEQDVYYRPSLFVVSNPHLEKTFCKNVTISSQLEDYTDHPTNSQPGVLMRNDTEWVGLTPLIARYAVLMAENCLTVRSADVMLRIIALISAKSDKTLRSAQDYLRRLENGEFGVIGDSSFSEGINMQSPPSNNGSYLTQFIELQQYLKGSFFGELGLRANYNMKREAIGQGESTLDEDAILPLCDNMLQCRRQDIEKINNLYGTDISVDFSSAWLRNHIENNITLLSQLQESGIARVNSDESGGVAGMDKSIGDVGKSGDNPGQDRDDTDQDRNDGEKGEIGEIDENEETGKENGSGSAGSDSAEEPDDGKVGDTGEAGEESGESVVGESEINDLAGEEIADAMAAVIEEAAEKLEVGKEKQDEFLGQTKGSGDESVTPDESGDIQSDAVRVESGDNS